MKWIERINFVKMTTLPKATVRFSTIPIHSPRAFFHKTRPKKFWICMEKEMATHSSVLACRIPRTEEPGELQSMWSHRVGHGWSDLAAAAWKHKRPRIGKTILRNRTDYLEESCFLSSHLTKSYEVKTVWFGRLAQNRHWSIEQIYKTDQWNRTESPEINPQTYN